MDPLEGRLQDHLGTGYAIQAELGGGGMSRVFVAEETALARRVVIKVLHPTLAATVSAERFEREILLVAGLNHPNIVPVLSAGECRGLPYFIMPFIEGESLRARITRGPLSVREALAVLKDVVRALAYAHNAGVVHRDIKPANILLTGAAAVVADFGVAKAVSAARERGIVTRSGEITGVGISLGTPQYMAPEQAAADPAADHRVDLYALGIVAYEMLTGSPPFHGRTPQALLTAQLTELPMPVAARRYDVPVGVASLVMQCLEKNPADRPRSAGD
ncbi:MAG TPA: serine/threonine-protein kinase, partial [Gemmatimonadaceae bacterium]|nr:serine/threonine-protein kinase [Gemmatimonadaceae bacterium]